MSGLLEANPDGDARREEGAAKMDEGGALQREWKAHEEEEASMHAERHARGDAGDRMTVLRTESAHPFTMLVEC